MISRAHTLALYSASHPAVGSGVGANDGGRVSTTRLVEETAEVDGTASKAVVEDALWIAATRSELSPSAETSDVVTSSMKPVSSSYVSDSPMDKEMSKLTVAAVARRRASLVGLGRRRRRVLASVTATLSMSEGPTPLRIEATPVLSEEMSSSVTDDASRPLRLNEALTVTRSAVEGARVGSGEGAGEGTGLGSAVGSGVGDGDGAVVGSDVGVAEGTGLGTGVVGTGEGKGVVGTGDGAADGTGEGRGVVGTGDGAADGTGEGKAEGIGDGAGDGPGDGTGDGRGVVGTGDGAADGTGEGIAEGAGDGAGDGAP